MRFFARIEDGKIYDCAEREDEADFLSRYHPIQYIDWVVIELPFCLANGSGYDPETGEVTPPEPVVVVIDYRKLTKVEFMDLSYPLLGSVARFGSIIRQAQNSLDDSVLAALERYRGADLITREGTAIFLTFLVNALDVDLTQEEADSVLDAWPVEE